MRGKRKKYRVYIRRSGTGCYDTGEDLLYFVGETWAASEKQAVNNVRFRKEGKAKNWHMNDDYCEDGVVFYSYEAKEATEG